MDSFVRTPSISMFHGSCYDMATITFDNGNNYRETVEHYQLGDQAVSMNSRSSTCQIGLQGVFTALSHVVTQVNHGSSHRALRFTHAAYFTESSTFSVTARHGSLNHTFSIHLQDEICQRHCCLVVSPWLKHYISNSTDVPYQDSKTTS